MKHLLLPALCSLLLPLTTHTALTLQLQFELPTEHSLTGGEQTITRIIAEDNNQITAQLLTLLNALATNNPTPSASPATDEQLRTLIHGLLSLQTELQEFATQLPPALQERAAQYAQMIDTMIEQSGTSAKGPNAGTTLRGIDMAEIQRAKLNKIIEQLDQLMMAVGTPSSTRAVAFETLEQEQQLSMIDLLRAMYQKLQAITG